MLIQAEEELNDKMLLSPQYCVLHMALQKHMGDGFVAMTIIDTVYDWVIIIIKIPSRT